MLTVVDVEFACRGFKATDTGFFFQGFGVVDNDLTLIPVHFTATGPDRDPEFGSRLR